MPEFKVMAVLGTRPEAIKLAPVIRELERCAAVKPVVCVTAQHRELLDQALTTFSIRPDYDLDIMRPNQGLADTFSRIMCALGGLFQQSLPDFVLVQGDTTTCLAAALAAFYHNIPIGHVEAGLRTGNLEAPFPEEAHRSMVARVASLHFAPTRQAKRNLLREGIAHDRILVTGNTGIDALHMALASLEAFPHQHWTAGGGGVPPEEMAKHHGPLVLVTAHRRESVGAPLRRLCRALGQLAARHPEWRFVYPMHPNPAAREEAISSLKNMGNVFLVESLDYLPFVSLMTRADVIVTDSGGIQEEAAALGKPTLVTRDLTERPEGVEVGGARLLGMSTARIVEGVEQALLNATPPQARTRPLDLYGDGCAAPRIVDAVVAFLAAPAQPREPTLRTRPVTALRRSPAKQAEGRASGRAFAPRPQPG